MPNENRPTAPRRRDSPDLEAIRQWQRIMIDSGIAVIAFFLFVYGALTVRDPAILALMFGAAATLLGFPVVRRIGGNGNE